MIDAVPLRSRPKRKLRYPAGPFIGMRDSPDPSAHSRERAWMLRNVYPLQPEFRGAVCGRPGFTKAGAQLGGGGIGQLVTQFTELDGTTHTVVIVGGKFYTYNWDTDSWTEVLTASDLSTASITLSATARCYAVTFANQLIVTDGVNTPWAWDGTANGGLTQLTNCPVLFGAPTVYYAKLFGIKATDRTAIVWSEENSPNTGYEAGGYNNAWTLGQTDQDRIFALAGTNEALYVFRARSLTQVFGSVTPNFSSTGTREGVAETVGTTSPASVCVHNRRIFFVDADGQPHVISPSLGLAPIWEDFRETIASFDPRQFANIEAYTHFGTDLVGFGYANYGNTTRDRQLMYHVHDEGEPIAAATFDGFSWTRIGTVLNARGKPVTMHVSEGGYVYHHGDSDGMVWDDGFSAGSRSIQHEVRSPPLGAEDYYEKTWDRLDFMLRIETAMTGIAIRHHTPRGVSTAQDATLMGGFSQWDVGIWDRSAWAGASVDLHQAVGIIANGRWFSWRHQHHAEGEQYCLIMATAEATVAGRYPETP